VAIWRERGEVLRVEFTCRIETNECFLGLLGVLVLWVAII